MHIRCVQCRSLTSVQIPVAPAAPLAFACSGCGRRYRLAVNRPRGSSDQERYRRAKTYAEENHIDLASAYSVLEGLMTLEEARGGRAPAAPPATQGTAEALAPAAPAQIEARPAPTAAPASGHDSTPPPRPAAPPAGVVPPSAAPTIVARKVAVPAATRPSLREDESAFDPGFAEAVRAGSLTVQQAVERGDRRALAMRMAQRHRMPMELALRVADNRMTVRQALTEKAAIESRVPPRPQNSVSHGVWNFMVFTMGGLILCALGVHVYGVWGDYLARNGVSGFSPEPAMAAERPAVPAPPRATVPLPPPPLTVPRTDSTGQLIEVVGPDPKSVLIAFCNSGRQGGQRQALEIVPAMPPSPGLRFGIFRSLDQQEAPFRAIRIRQDPRTGRWVAGDGRAPITTEEPPPQVPGVQSVPVTRQAPPTLTDRTSLL